MSSVIHEDIFVEMDIFAGKKKFVKKKINNINEFDTCVILKLFYIRWNIIERKL